MPPENSIIILADDTFTAGGTLAALIDQLTLGGRTPLIATTLAGGRYGIELRPTKKLTDGLLEKAGLTEQQFQLEFGSPPNSLPQLRCAPTFSPEEEESMEQERSSMQQELEEELEKLRAWKRENRR